MVYQCNSCILFRHKIFIDETVGAKIKERGGYGKEGRGGEASLTACIVAIIDL